VDPLHFYVCHTQFWEITVRCYIFRLFFLFIFICFAGFSSVFLIPWSIVIKVLSKYLDECLVCSVMFVILTCTLLHWIRQPFFGLGNNQVIHWGSIWCLDHTINPPSFHLWLSLKAIVGLFQASLEDWFHIVAWYYYCSSLRRVAQIWQQSLSQIVFRNALDGPKWHNPTW